MNTYNTGNPIGSTSPKDLLDNASNFDEAMNSSNPTFTNRLGVPCDTWVGQQALFNLAQEGRTAEFQSFLESSGFVSLGNYASGLEFTAYNQYMARGGYFYRPAPSSVPFTTTGTWDGADEDLFILFSQDDILRQELADVGGAQMIGYTAGMTVAEALDSVRTVTSYPGYSTAPDADNSAAAAAMIASTNTLIVGAGETLVAKNLLLPAGCRVIVDGKLKLPNGCTDFDRLLYSEPGTTGLFIDVAEIDGNAANQSGDLGTHLVYLNQPVNHFLHVQYAHDHYASTGNAPSPDGVRDSSSGAIFVYKPTGGSTLVKYLKHWGREGVQIREGVFSQAQVIYAEGREVGGTEYSGIQMSGYGHILKDSAVRWAGASGIGFDVTKGIAGRLVSINSRENHGVNFGHTGFPASDSVVASVVVDGAFIHGISVGAATQRLSIANLSVSNCGESCVNVSDNAGNVKISNGFARHGGFSNVNAYIGLLELSGVDISTLDVRVLRVQVTSGRFVDGEDIVISGGGSGTIRKVIYNVTGNFQILFLSVRSGSSAPGASVTGATSGAAASVISDYAPARKSESAGGRVVEDISYNDDGGLGVTIKFSDGTVIHTAFVQVAATANTLTTKSQNYPSATSFISLPMVIGSISSVDSTDSFDVSRLTVTGTQSSIQIKLKATVSQKYTVVVESRGRWKA